MRKPLLRILYITLLIALWAGVGACTFSEEPQPCPYNIKLEYWYAGSGLENMLPLYVDNLQQYIFDEQGKLLSVYTAKGNDVKQWSGTRGAISTKVRKPRRRCRARRGSPRCRI